MSDVLCLDCDHEIKLPSNAQEGDSIICENCDAEFEIVSLNPPKIEWMYDEYDDAEEWDDDDEYEYEEEEDDDDDKW